MECAAAELADLGRALGTRPTLYYESDADLLMLARFADVLAPHFRFLLPREGLVEELLDKRRFQALAARRGLPVPREVRAGGAERLPCVIKPASRIGWYDSPIIRSLQANYKAIKASTLEELRYWTAEMERYRHKYVVQEFIGGDDSQLVSFHAFLDHRSQPLAWFVGRKVRTFPLDTGQSTCLELARDPRLVDLGIEILRMLEFRGVAKMDFKRDPASGELRLLEINARFSLWHYLGEASGVNLPSIAHGYLSGQPVTTPGTYRLGVRWISPRGDIKAGLAGLREGRWGLRQWLCSYLGPKIYNGLSWRDPIPAIGGAARWFRGVSGRIVGLLASPARRARPFGARKVEAPERESR